MAETFEREAPRLDSATRVARARVIQERETAYQTRARTLDEQMQNRQAELIRPIMENLQRIIEQVRAEDGYAMIFDVASQASVIVAADKSLDLTPKVLARVKAAPAPAPVAGAPMPQPSGVTAPRR
jgi:outer membrane protein